MAFTSEGFGLKSLEAYHQLLGKNEQDCARRLCALTSCGFLTAVRWDSHIYSKRGVLKFYPFILWGLKRFPLNLRQWFLDVGNQAWNHPGSLITMQVPEVKR